MKTPEEQYQKNLEEQRAALATFLQRQNPNSLEGQFNAPDEHRLVQWMHNRLESTECALERLANGEFGVCQQCQRQIDPERLKALPDATLCIECQLEAVPLVRRRSWHRLPKKAYQGGATCMMPS